MQSVKRLSGLVVCGGQSSRMGVDKSLLDYYGQPQRYHVYKMLTTLCDETFISCNRDQAKTIDRRYKIIADAPAYAGNGPMSGLLTAFNLYSGADWLIAGCDYPYLTRNALNGFIKSIDTKKTAAAFYDNRENVYEPMLAWYSYPASDEIKKMFGRKEYSLQHFLRKTNAGKYVPAESRVMQSVDTQEEYQKVKKDLIANAQWRRSSQQLMNE